MRGGLRRYPLLLGFCSGVLRGQYSRSRLQFLWQQDSLEDWGSRSHLNLRNMTAMLERRDSHQRTQCPCTWNAETYSHVVLVFITKKRGESNFIYTNRA